MNTAVDIEPHYCGESVLRSTRRRACNDRASVQVRPNPDSPWHYMCSPHWAVADKAVEVIYL